MHTMATAPLQDRSTREFKLKDPLNAASRWWHPSPRSTYLAYAMYDRVLLYAWVNNRREAVAAITDVMAFAALVTQGIFPFPESFAMSKRTPIPANKNADSHASGYLLWRVPPGFLECVKHIPGLEISSGRGRGTVLASEMPLLDFDLIIVDPEWCYHRRNRFSCPQNKQTDPITAGIAMLSAYFKADYGLKLSLKSPMLNNSVKNSPGAIDTLEKLSVFNELSHRRLQRSLQHQFHLFNAKVFAQLESPLHNSSRFAQKAPYYEVLRSMNAITQNGDRVNEAKRQMSSFFAVLRSIPYETAIKQGLEIESGDSEAAIESSSESSDDDQNWPCLPSQPPEPMQPTRQLIPDKPSPLPPRPARAMSSEAPFKRSETVLDLPCCHFEDDEDEENKQVELGRGDTLSPGFECILERPCFKFHCKQCLARRWSICQVISDTPKKSSVWFGPDAPMPLAGQCRMNSRWGVVG
jgi:hypothetical protein